MKKILYTTTAFILCGIAQSQAACIATPSCTTLGYTESSSCDGGLKCPFGSYWYCPSNSGTNSRCEEFSYLCIGTGYVDGGGVGAACDGKYAKCTCSEGYSWKDKKGCVKTCFIGSILFSDMSCSQTLEDGKTPIGVVVYIDGNGGGQALALNSIGSYVWGNTKTDIPELKNMTSDSTASTDYASCENSKIIMAAGDKSKYPAVWAAHEYSTEGTKAGDWCLPAAGIFSSYFSNLDKVDAGFDEAGGAKFLSTGRFGTVTNAWSSTKYYERIFGDTESDYFNAWFTSFYTNIGVEYPYGIRDVDRNKSLEVRPVLEF